MTDPQSVPPAYTPAPVTPKRTLSIVGMVLGIVSLLGIFVIGLGFLPGIAAIIVSVLARRREPAGRPFSLTGLITGIVGTVIGLIVFAIYLVAIIFIASHPGSISN